MQMHQQQRPQNSRQGALRHPRQTCPPRSNPTPPQAQSPRPRPARPCLNRPRRCPVRPRLPALNLRKRVRARQD